MMFLIQCIFLYIYKTNR